MTFVFAPPAVASVAVVGTADRFPVRRIFCVGRNYAAHAREMGKDPEREAPFFFTKPADAVVASEEDVAYPPLTRDLHHEIELVVALGKAGADIAQDGALDHVYGYAVGNDLTRRDLQLEARDRGRPWDWGKAFDRSAVCGPIYPVDASGHPSPDAAITLSVNGTQRQKAQLADLIWSVPEIISILSQSVRVAPGDLIYTGTPAGVGPLSPGDVCVGAIDGFGTIQTRIVDASAQ